MPIILLRYIIYNYFRIKLPIMAASKESYTHFNIKTWVANKIVYEMKFMAKLFEQGHDFPSKFTNYPEINNLLENYANSQLFSKFFSVWLEFNLRVLSVLSQ